METRNFARGLFLGGIAGALAGFLLAPKPGREFRGDVKERANKTFEEAKRIYSDSRIKAKAVIEDAKIRAGELRREADRQFSEARLKAKEIWGRKEESPEAEKASEEPTPHTYH